MKKNPRPRAKVSGRKIRIGKRGMEFAGYGRARLRTARDPRRMKKFLRKAGFRVNPKRRAPAYSEVSAVVTTMDGSALASFRDQKEAVSWARKYARAHRCKLRIIDPR